MADLISRQAAMDNLKKSLAFSENELDIGEFRRGCIAAIRDDIGNIKHLPAADAVEVVRCAQCIYSNSCEIEGMLLGDGIENPYCAGGERREENHLTFSSLEDVVNG